MIASDIDTLYTELANAIHRVGPDKAQLFLATLALSLLSEQKNGSAAIALIAQSERLAKI